ncbi:unnamed protein product [Closterium sp. NIES-53]
MRPGDDVKPVLEKIKDTYARMAAAGSNVSQMQQCTKIISVLDNSWDNLIPTLNSQQDQWTLEWLRQQILQEDFRRRHTGGGKANPGMFLMVEDLKRSEGDVSSVGKVVMHPLTHWVIDSSCTSHMTPRADFIDEVKPLRKIKFVDVASGALLPVIGVGNAKVMGANEELVGLGNMLLVEGLSANLLSVHRLQKSKAKASSGSGEADWETWHERLCHVNFPMLQKLVKDGSLMGLEVKGAAKEIRSCPTCLETKFTKFPLSSGTGPAKAPLALVHMDVVGPTRAPSLSGSRYFLTIVDDHTRVVWVYPLKTKGEVAVAVLKEWMPRAQRESGHKVKVICTDNGGEFIGNDFEVVLKKKGIQRQLTVPYNPQPNGGAERFNRTLQEGARTLLGRAGLPDPFWVTALRQVALEKRGKLEASGRWGLHLGIAKDHRSWLVWDLTSQKLTVLRDVNFLESLYYKEWKQQQQQKLPTTPLIIEADEVQRPSRQVQVTVSKKEISGVTEDGGEPEVEEQQQQQQQQQDPPPCAQRPPDRPRRDVRPPNRLTYPAGPMLKKWKQSVKEEYDSLLENETWELCEQPPGKKANSSKLIFRHKYGPDGELTRYKSRLVAKGFQHIKGKDFDKIFAHVGKGTTLRVMLGTAANRGWRIKQIDITTAFLHGIILEELYMLQPEGLDDGSGRVCRLKKAIYGLKQAPRAWYHKLEETLLAGGFKKSECDHTLFVLHDKNEFLMLLVYVDDILLFSESYAMIERLEEMQFKCSKMGDVKYYLGIHVERDLDKGVLRLHQRKYCEGLVEKYGLQDGGKPATHYLRVSLWSPVLMRSCEAGQECMSSWADKEYQAKVALGEEAPGQGSAVGDSEDPAAGG